MDKGDIVEVTWVDSVTGGGWMKPASSPLEHKTYGILYAAEDDRYIITSTITHTGLVLSPLHIPREAVKSIRVLE